jgi:hypothetical protein
MLTRAETEALLGQLCVRYGFCPLLSDTEVESFVGLSPTQFTTAVIRAVGLDPTYVDTRLSRKMRDHVAAFFETARDRRQHL